ncbi:glycosyltransferase family protein [Frigidibacter sp. MR17.14]|uniref:glycosyltransferase family protein n=1 Tax=Frigidibacter sp. MR17.14 TaxID=3126509 RepID=UPI003012CD61
MDSPSFDNARILMYSHDTFGLGHLRRCREIAHALVEAHRGLSVLIISGATIAGAFDYRVRVDFLKIPSVIKLRNGEYTSLAAHTKLEDTLAMRRALIRQTAETFRPDIFITDKEPMGLHGEIEETLDYLKAQGTRLVLGLREVMDAPHLLAAEWARSDMLRKIERYYDSIWAYGPEGFHDPLGGLDVSPALRARMRYTGFLQRSVHRHADTPSRDLGDYILVTTGGGGDGAELIRDVFAAYRADPGLTRRAVVVLGPYLPARERSELLAAGDALPRVEVIEFDNRMEDLIAGAQAVVGMGGYNTYCEILSFDRPALIVPRVTPREEQLIRASRAAELGLIRMMRAEESADPLRLAAALQTLPDARRPSQAPATPGVAARDLGGLARITAEVGHWLEDRRKPRLTAVHG